MQRIWGIPYLSLMIRLVGVQWWYVWLLAAGGFLASCESDLEAPITVQPRLTIVANLSPATWEPQRVFVYTSLSPSDSASFHTPGELLVEITDEVEGKTIRLDSARQGGRVFFPVPAGFIQGGHRYSISATAPGFSDVNARTEIPLPSSISELTIQGLTVSPSDKHEFKEILRYALAFQINHLDDNRYYHLIFYNEYEGLPNRYFIIDPQPSDDQVFLRHYDYGVLLDRNDLRAEGPLTFRFIDWVVENQGLKRVYVELRSISEEYYKYHSTLARQVIIRQDPFAEPVSIFNNIHGGYGNFSGFNPFVGSSGLPE